MNTEQQLVDAGFVQTPEVAHTGTGHGKVYAKSFDNVVPFDEKNPEGGKHFDYYVVNPDGTVAPYGSNAGVTATEPKVEDQPAQA